jgi:hypothetical protein
MVPPGDPPHLVASSTVIDAAQEDSRNMPVFSKDAGGRPVYVLGRAELKP